MHKNRELIEFYYDEHPFDVLDLSDKEEMIRSVQDGEYELKTFIQKIPPEELILDVGSGPGRVSSYLNMIGHKVIALDYSHISLKILRSHCSIPCVLGDNLNLPFKSNVVPAVISTGVIHHTPDPYKSLRENCRVLKEGGQLYLRTYAHQSYYDYLYRYLGGSLRRMYSRGKLGRFVVNRIAFLAFVLVRSLVRPHGTHQLNKLYAIYSNSFLKTGVSFLERAEIEKVLHQENLRILDYRKKGYMHLFIAQKSD